MHKQRLLWHLFPAFLLIALISLLAISLYAIRSVGNFYRAELVQILDTRAILIETKIRDKFIDQDFKAVDELAKTLGDKSQTRITVILPSGKVIADSHHDVAKMDLHDDRPEIQAAMAGQADGVISSIRYSYTLEQDLVYLARPIKRDGKVVGVIRLAMSIGRIKSQLSGISFRIAIGGTVVLILASVISLIIARRITKPLEEMKKGADKFASGDLSWRLAVPKTMELGSLAEGMNSMASQLDQRIRSLMHQRNEQQAVLSSMVEGVLAIDMDERMISINDAGARLLEIDPNCVHGKSIQEVVRNTELQELVARTLSSSEPVEGDIVIRDSKTCYLQAHGTILHDANNVGMGAVIVLNDVTRIRKLETVRRDFVANVSHELKTPITSIKGFVETLLDGAVNNPEDAERFLKIVARQTERLNAIIEDILSLSRIEDQTEKDKIAFDKYNMYEMLESSIGLCELQAREKKINVDLECDKSFFARLNAPLMEQAIVNLISNAIKYSDEGENVSVCAKQIDDKVIMSVSDSGTGIEKEHLERIFERFYRVDKARSRNLGGTGLGLAIAKHIVLIHQGDISVESKIGKGTTFTITIPFLSASDTN